MHFLRFELTSDAVAALKAGKGLAMGVDHPEVAQVLDPVPVESVQSLIGDLA